MKLNYDSKRLEERSFEIVDGRSNDDGLRGLPNLYAPTETSAGKDMDLI